ncbi:hypothetical protein CALCODRAFT_344712 [Calocera cornea HHB12733]|uniref:Uncharacterized protein n=1 Tax=Calocera cornea HHB12733 TaxID=1353952 RepID=A0A165EWC8_9BASI|nr:hypothetical protein CALCODRAFT_344712 [Calocera cornea HHB12733]
MDRPLRPRRGSSLFDWLAPKPKEPRGPRERRPSNWPGHHNARPAPFAHARTLPAMPAVPHVPIFGTSLVGSPDRNSPPLPGNKTATTFFDHFHAVSVCFSSPLCSDTKPKVEW